MILALKFCIIEEKIFIAHGGGKTIKTQTVEHSKFLVVLWTVAAAYII